MRTLLLALAVATSDPAADLGIELSDLTPLEAPAGLQLYRARGADPVDGTIRELSIGALTLGPPLEAARLTVAVGSEGRIVHATVVGTPAVEGDHAIGWQLFLGQLCEFGALGPADEFVRGGAASPADLKAWRAELSSGPDGPLVEALIEQRATMRALTLFQRRLILDAPGFEAAQLDAVDPWLESLATCSERLEPVLGTQGSSEHRQQVGLLRERLGALASMQASELPAQARRLCSGCHTRPAPAGGDWTDATSALRHELSFPTGALVVGYDLAAAPGDDGVRSQRVADGVRTLLEAAAGH
jgi:hypothetical protein